MVAKVVSLEEARARLPCRRVERRPSSSHAAKTRLDRALAALSGCEGADFPTKVRVFKAALAGEDVVRDLFGR